MTQAGDEASELGRLRADNLRLVEIIARYETRYQDAMDEIERLMKLVDTLYREKNSERETYTNAIDRYCTEIDQLRTQVRLLRQQRDQGGDDL